MDLPLEVVNIPYENGKSLPGYFLKADASDEPRPTLMSVGGGDSLAEELYFWGGGAAALQRGYNALLFEIPGQRGAMYSESRCRTVLSAGHRGSAEIRLRLGTRSRGCRSESPCPGRLEYGREFCTTGSSF